MSPPVLRPARSQPPAPRPTWPVRRRLGPVLALGASLVSWCAAVEPPPPPAGGSTLVVLPDTQYYYSNYRAGNFSKWYAQMDWLRLHAAAHSLAYVVHLGDITDEGDNSSGHVTQWSVARSMVRALLAEVPVALTTGNHDGAGDSRDSLFQLPANFGPGSLYATQPSLVESFTPEDPANSVHFLEFAGRPWLVLTLEWAPRDAVLEWADEVLTAYPERSAAVVVHAYLFRDSARYHWDLLGAGDAALRQSGNPLGYDGVAGDPAGVNDGERIWARVLRHHPNVRLVLSGHVSRAGHGRRVGFDADGRLVHQHLVNFQHWPGDGDGFLRLLQADAGGETITVRTWSPYNGQLPADPDLQFSFHPDDRPVPMGPEEARRELAPALHWALTGEDAGRPRLSRGDIPWAGLPAGFSGGDAGRFPAGASVVAPAGPPAEALTVWLRPDPAEEPAPLYRDAHRVVELAAPAPATWSGLAWEAEPRATWAGTDHLVLELPSDRWSHLALVRGPAGWRVLVNGENLGEGPSSGPLSGAFTLGGGYAGRLEDFTLFSDPPPAGELERLRRSSFRLATGRRQEADARDQPPGLIPRPDLTGGAAFGQSEPTYLRLPERPGVDRFPVLRRVPQACDPAEGALLATAAGPATGRVVNVSWIATNPAEPLYRAEYGGTGLAILGARAYRVAGGTPQAEAGDTACHLLHLPFAPPWVAGHVRANGARLAVSPDFRGSVAYDALRPRYTLLTEGPADSLLLATAAQPGAIAAVVRGTGGVGDGVEIYGADRRRRSGDFSFALLRESDPDLLLGAYPEAPAGASLTVQRVGPGRYLVPVERPGDWAAVATPLLDGDQPPALLRVETGTTGIVIHAEDPAGQPLESGFRVALRALGPVATEDPGKAWRAAVPDAAPWRAGWHWSPTLGWLWAGDSPGGWFWSPTRGWGAAGSLSGWPLPVFWAQPARWRWHHPSWGGWSYDPEAGWAAGG